MTERSHGYERIVREPRWAIRLVTLLILAAGIVVIAYAVTRPEARRERAVSGLSIGDSSSTVIARLGRSQIVCPATELAHLHGRFPPGWPTAARQQAIERLQVETTERWIYPLDIRRPLSCGEGGQATEIGIGSDGRVLWIVPLRGRQPLQLPDTLAPGTFTEDPDV